MGYKISIIDNDTEETVFETTVEDNQHLLIHGREAEEKDKCENCGIEFSETSIGWGRCAHCEMSICAKI